MPKVDDVNGLVYMAIRWIASASLLSHDELVSLESQLKMHAAQHNDEDSIALRCFATAVQGYLSTSEGA
jgi:hypothetical protein